MWGVLFCFVFVCLVCLFVVFFGGGVVCFLFVFLCIFVFVFVFFLFLFFFVFFCFVLFLFVCLGFFGGFFLGGGGVNTHDLFLNPKETVLVLLTSEASSKLYRLIDVIKLRLSLYRLHCCSRRGKKTNFNT